METITHLNLKVEGVPFVSIRELEIKHQFNEHAVAVVSGEIESSIAQQYLQRTDEKVQIRITTTASGQPQILFWGIVNDISVKLMNEYAFLTLTLKSLSAMSDLQKHNRSFQNIGATHQDVLTTVFGNQALVHMNVTDNAIGNMIVQCNETDWQFCKRIASKLSAPVITSINNVKPIFSIGMPVTANTYDLSSIELSAASQGMGKKDLLAEDTMSTAIHTQQFVFVGDSIQCGAGNRRVRGILSTLKSGALITAAYITTERAFKQIPVTNQQISGKMYLAEVKDVHEDKVKVKFLDIESADEDGGTTWLPYSTAYSSSDGSGFYCMPAVGDQVRVFFPAADEGQAFVASSVCVSPGASVTDKKWSGPGGKQILLTEKGIYITTNANDNKIFIDLTDDAGITIKSAKNITICAKNNLSLMSNNNINIAAQNDILISTAESYIDITAQGIELGAENVVIK